MEPIITTTALASFLSLLFTEGGKTLATESVKLALEKRPDIKDGFVNLFKRDEIITLGLNEEKSPEEVTALLKANPEVAGTVAKTIEGNSDLLNQLLEIIKEQSGKDSSNITINAKNIAAAGTVTIQNQTNTFS
jgi:hypothetical protein